MECYINYINIVSDITYESELTQPFQQSSIKLE